MNTIKNSKMNKYNIYSVQYDTRLYPFKNILDFPKQKSENQPYRKTSLFQNFIGPGKNGIINFHNFPKLSKTDTWYVVASYLKMQLSVLVYSIHLCYVLWGDRYVALGGTVSSVGQW